LSHQVSLRSQNGEPLAPFASDWRYRFRGQPAWLSISCLDDDLHAAGTFLLTWPRTNDLALAVVPDATPRSASATSPGQLTTQPITAHQHGHIEALPGRRDFVAKV